MKFVPPMILLWAMAWTCMAEMRTFEDPLGRKMLAEMTGMEDGLALLKKEDGTVLKVDPKKFSKGDQEFIAKWATENAAVMPSKLTLTASEKDTDAGAVYEIEAFNGEDRALKNLRVVYAAYVKPAGKIEMQPMDHQMDVAELPAGKRAVFDSTLLVRGRSWSKQKGEIGGILISVYEDERLIAQERIETTKGILKDKPWPESTPAGAVAATGGSESEGAGENMAALDPDSADAQVVFTSPSEGDEFGSGGAVVEGSTAGIPEGYRLFLATKRVENSSFVGTLRTEGFEANTAFEQKIMLGSGNAGLRIIFLYAVPEAAASSIDEFVQAMQTFWSEKTGEKPVLDRSLMEDAIMVGTLKVSRL